MAQLLSPQIDESFRPAFGLGGPTAQCIISSIVRFINTLGVSSTEEILETPDGDELILDYFKTKHLQFHAKAAESAPIVLAIHGLGGSATSGYMLQLAYYLAERNVRCVGISLRGSKRPNKTSKFFHAGAVDDPYFVLKHLTAKYPNCNFGVAGFSIGAAMTLNLLHYHDSKLDASDRFQQLKCAVALSPPINFFGSNEALERNKYWNHYLTLGLKVIIRAVDKRLAEYEKVQKHVLAQIEVPKDHKEYISIDKTMVTCHEIAGLIAKHNMKHVSPYPIQPSLVRGASKVRDIIDYVTGPLHLFKDVDDYFGSTQPKNIIMSIKTPTLVIRSIDDPFLDPLDCYNQDFLSNPVLELKITEHGSHIGHLSFGVPDSNSKPVPSSSQKNDTCGASGASKPSACIEKSYLEIFKELYSQPLPQFYLWSELEAAKYFAKQLYAL